MTTPQLTLSAPSAAETRMIASVSAAHFISHFYFLVLPPLFLFVRAEYGLNYTELALAITVFNIVSAIFQTPAGMVADRVGSFVVLIAGLVLGSLAFALVGLVHSYWFLVAMFGVAGLANTVYHPADYALLSHHVASERMGSAFSIHTFAGMLGGAVAPASDLVRASVVRMARGFPRLCRCGSRGRGRTSAAAGRFRRQSASCRQGARRGGGGRATRAVAVVANSRKLCLLHHAVGERRRHSEFFPRRLEGACSTRRSRSATSR